MTLSSLSLAPAHAKLDVVPVWGRNCQGYSCHSLAAVVLLPVPVPCQQTRLESVKIGRGQARVQTISTGLRACVHVCDLFLPFYGAGLCAGNDVRTWVSAGAGTVPPSRGSARSVGRGHVSHDAAFEQRPALALGILRVHSPVISESLFGWRGKKQRIE
jgi:hypothetical protein